MDRDREIDMGSDRRFAILARRLLGPHRMKQPKHVKKQLPLVRQTVRVLDPKDLEVVVGGGGYSVVNHVDRSYGCQV